MLQTIFLAGRCNARQTTKEETMKQTVLRGAALVTTTQLKRIALATSIIAALALSSVAFAGGTLAGKYTTKITSPPEFAGTWVMNFAQGGTYTVADNGHILVRGKYSTTGSKLTLGHETGDGACAKSGTYTWKRSGKTLQFKRLSDPAACAGRRGVLAHTFTRK
jgi:hypothetical protein